MFLSLSISIKPFLCVRVLAAWRHQYVATSVTGSSVAVTVFDLQAPVKNRVPRVMDSYVDEVRAPYSQSRLRIMSAPPPHAPLSPHRPPSSLKVHCTEDLCYAVDVDRFRIVSFDPREASSGEVVQTTTVVTYGLAFDGVLEDGSALDRDNLVKVTHRWRYESS
jgi:hypothetical protein